MRISELDFGKLSSDNKYDLIMDGVTENIEGLKSDVIIVIGCSPILLYDRVLKAKELYENGVSKNIVFSGRIAWQSAWRNNELLKDKYVKDIDRLINYSHYYDDKYKALHEKYSLMMARKYEKKVLSFEEKMNLEKLQLTEARLMELFINELNSMKDANIYSESLSDNTPENAKYTRLLLDTLVKEGKISKYHKVIIVTISWHVRRAYLTFKKYFSDKEIVVIPSTNDLKRNNVTFEIENYYSFYPNAIDSECKKLILYSNNESISDVFLEDILPLEKAEDIEKKQKSSSKNII